MTYENKKLITLGLALICVVLLSHGVINYEDTGRRDDFEVSVDYAPTYFKSFEELDNYLTVAKAYNNGEKSAVSSLGDGEWQSSIEHDIWFLKDMSVYYAPSWVPDNASLYSIAITERYIVYYYVLPEYNSDSADNHERSLNNIITFEWTRVENAEKLLRNDIGRTGSSPVKEGAELYYYDYGTIDWPNRRLARTYFWLQDDYEFMLTLPLRALSNMEITADITEDADLEDSTISAEKQLELIYNSAVKIDIN